VPANTWIPHILSSRFDAGTAFVVSTTIGAPTDVLRLKTTDWGKTWTSLATKEPVGWTEAIEEDRRPRPALPGHFLRPLHVERRRKALDALDARPATTEVADLVVHPRDHDW